MIWDRFHVAVKIRSVSPQTVENRPEGPLPYPCEDVDLQTARPGDGVQAAFSSMVR
jgi:hypothetical protein